MNNYYEAPVETIDEYLIHTDRLAGLIGSANHTAIFLVTTMIFPLLKIVNEGTPAIKKSLYAVYVFAVVYVFLIMSGSRAAIFISLLILVLILVAATRRLKDVLLVVILMLLLTLTGIYLYNRFESDIIIQNRITESIRGENFQLSAEGMAKWVNRYGIWQERFDTFHREGNSIAILIGLGYTKAYMDYADNGIIGAFINNGLIGLILTLFLLYVFIKYGLFRTMRFYRTQEINFSYMAFAFSAFALVLYELTGDMIEHYKLGQLFYLFLSMILVVNGKVYLDNK